MLTVEVFPWYCYNCNLNWSIIPDRNFKHSNSIHCSYSGINDVMMFISVHMYESEHHFFLLRLWLNYCIFAAIFPIFKHLHLNHCKELYVIAKGEYLMKKFSKYFLWICLAINFIVLKPLTPFLQGDALKQTFTSVRNAFLAKAELQHETGANNNGIPFPAECLQEIIFHFFERVLSESRKILGDTSGLLLLRDFRAWVYKQPL